MASLALVSLKYLDQDNAYRRQLAKWYRMSLFNTKGVNLIPIPDNCESSTHLFQILVENRNELLSILNQNEIYPGVHYTCNMEYKMYNYGKESFFNSRAISNRVISLPLHLGISKKDIVFICEIIKNHVN